MTDERGNHGDLGSAGLDILEPDEAAGATVDVVTDPNGGRQTEIVRSPVEALTADERDALIADAAKYGWDSIGHNEVDALRTSSEAQVAEMDKILEDNHLKDTEAGMALMGQARRVASDDAAARLRPVEWPKGSRILKDKAEVARYEQTRRESLGRMLSATPKEYEAVIERWALYGAMRTREAAVARDEAAEALKAEQWDIGIEFDDRYQAKLDKQAEALNANQGGLPSRVMETLPTPWLDISRVMRGKGDVKGFDASMAEYRSSGELDKLAVVLQKGFRTTDGIEGARKLAEGFFASRFFGERLLPLIRPGGEASEDINMDSLRADLTDLLLDPSKRQDMDKYFLLRNPRAGEDIEKELGPKKRWARLRRQK